MALIELAYVSIETRPMSPQDLMDILEIARKKNKELDITGMLLYRDGYFIQALEGEEAAVTELYNTIAQDDRHTRVLIIEKASIESRSFGEWSMGFQNLNEMNPSEIEGYTDYLDNPDDLMQKPSQAHEIGRASCRERV
jgi:tRNA U34 5-methylaminomethyl-2-thiouridine-forming methyltransferase MnmC